ncbi:MAG: hypothetical protein GY925_26015 [Actinomycetia bacterium]|nr:hypothetical protein [Actinomycetes bacterium]
MIREAADVLKGVQLIVWSGAFYGKDPLYGDPTDAFVEQMTAAYYESQGLHVPDGEREATGAMTADVHRAADRTNTTDGQPLLWQGTERLAIHSLTAEIDRQSPSLVAYVRLPSRRDLNGYEFGYQRSTSATATPSRRVAGSAMTRANTQRRRWDSNPRTLAGHTLSKHFRSR